ncbi:TolC family protein [Ideonella sp. BN130291]|uniref:TolC family protein n=1 Tax=Ideonella sp. BN130291 TaxID=3112940 RepID=UPI002E272ECD|nr:TolC family protein [Ideonella sp. BN130291]
MPASFHHAVRGLALAVLAAAAPAIAGPLGFDDSLRLAQQRSLQLPAQAAAATAAREMAVAAGQRPDPTLKVGVANLPVNGSDRFSLTSDFMTMRSIGVMQELTRPGKLQARSARLEREAAAAETQRQWLLANLQRDTATAWLDRHFLQRMQALLAEQRTEARLQVDAAEAAYRGRTGSQADVFAARSAVALVEDRLAQTGRELATAGTMLARWVGPAAGEAPGPAPALDRLRWSDDDLDAVVAHHPELALMAQQESIAQADADLARSNLQPDPSVELMFSQRGPGYSNMVSVTVSVPLQWDRPHRQDRELAARLATVAQVRAQREEATRAHAADTRALLQEWRSARQRLQRYDDALQPLAQQRSQAALAAYRGGAGPLAAVLEARRAEIDTRMDRLRLEMEAARLWVRLNTLAPWTHGEPEAQR